MKRTTKKEQARAAAIAAIRSRLNDLAVGAGGSKIDEEGCVDIFSKLGAKGAERWLRAIGVSFDLETDERTGLIWRLAHWRLGEFETLDSAAEWIYQSIEDTGRSKSAAAKGESK